MAEGILKARWAALGRNDLSISSMGVHGLDHQPATEPARRICMQHGIDISSHVSRPLEFDEMNRCDLMLAMEMAQKDFILLLIPQLADRIFLLGSWPLKDSPKGNIRDPIGGGLKDYGNAYETISRRIDHILPYLQSLFA
jgi:protein-tyrosine phosphatase